jgi:hypothetical protein
VFVDDVLGEDGELVAAQARHDVARAHVFLDAARRLDEELVAGAVAQAVVDQLEAVEVEIHHRELRARMRFAALDRLGQAFVEAAAVGEVGERVVIGDVLQPAFRAAARRDVLHLQDQARVALLVAGEETAVQRHPYLAAAAVTAADLDRHRLDVMLGHADELLFQDGSVIGEGELGETMADHVGFVVSEQRAKRPVDLQHRACQRHQRHADGRVREGAVETAFAVRELFDVAGGLRGLALGGFDARAAHLLVGLLLAEIEVQGGQQHADDRGGSD